eukprot:CAMPEP_0196660622 /NCGR_PEP_ID=MMETSP1086-20130531/40675_1 /TAXON_ID=77921 /ORGANISM="Cyanoptyche  gloeocystis , Strain SAG4.97" /LENGTH=159 /DNA_ID=CAMNT_0041995131 /DNA_START=109 /DNA_END=589 /DNA_ORIENTATION=+
MSSEWGVQVLAPIDADESLNRHTAHGAYVKATSVCTPHAAHHVTTLQEDAIDGVFTADDALAIELACVIAAAPSESPVRCGVTSASSLDTATPACMSSYGSSGSASRSEDLLWARVATWGWAWRGRLESRLSSSSEAFHMARSNSNSLEEASARAGEEG